MIANLLRLICVYISRRFKEIPKLFRESKSEATPNITSLCLFQQNPLDGVIV